MSKHTITKREFSVVGMQYRVTLTMRRELQKLLPFTVFVARDRTNTHDENAMDVRIGDVDIPMYPMRLGYLRRQVAEILAPAFDNGSMSVGKAKLTAIDAEAGTGTVEIWLKHKGNSPLTKA